MPGAKSLRAMTRLTHSGHGHRQSTLCRLHKQVLQHSRDCAECEEKLRSPRYFRQE